MQRNQHNHTGAASVTNYPEGTVGIEIRGIYDGVSVWKLPSGEMVNRWPVDDWRHKPTQEWIERMEAGES
jgi:hypothetical protein